MLSFVVTLRDTSQWEVLAGLIFFPIFTVIVVLPVFLLSHNISFLMNVDFSAFPAAP